MTKNYFVNSNNIIEEKNTPIYITNTPDDDVIIQNSITGFNEESDGFKVGLDGNSNGIISHRENKDIILSTNNTEKLRLSSSLVKTNGPHQVDGNLEVNGNLKLHSDINMENSAEFKVKTNNLERLIIKNDGKVGINKTNPTEKLDIDGNIKGNELNVNNSIIKLNNNLGSAGQVMKVNSGANALEWGSAGSSVFTTSGNDIYYNSGNVGIGTTDPKSSLHVVGPRTNTGTDLTKGIHMGEAGANDYAIEIVAGNSTRASYIDFTVPQTDNKVRMIYVGSSNRFTIESNNDTILNPGGKIGISNTNPTEKLTVNGNILASGSITANSDARVKTNIIDEDCEDIYEKFKLLNLKNYSYEENYCKSTNKDEDEYVSGLIAQEVAEIYPDVVDIKPKIITHTEIEQDESDGIKPPIYEYSKTYEDFHIIKVSKLNMKLFGVAKVLQNKVEELEDEIIKLEGTNEDLNDRLDMVSRVMDNLIIRLEDNNVI